MKMERVELASLGYSFGATILGPNKYQLSELKMLEQAVF